MRAIRLLFRTSRARGCRRARLQLLDRERMDAAPPSTSATGVDAEKAREKGAEFAREAAKTTKEVAGRTEVVMSEAAITAKINIEDGARRPCQSADHQRRHDRHHSDVDWNRQLGS